MPNFARGLKLRFQNRRRAMLNGPAFSFLLAAQRAGRERIEGLAAVERALGAGKPPRRGTRRTEQRPPPAALAAQPARLSISSPFRRAIARWVRAGAPEARGLNGRCRGFAIFCRYSRRSSTMRSDNVMSTGCAISSPCGVRRVNRAGPRVDPPCSGAFAA